MNHWEFHEGKAGAVIGGGGRRLQGKYVPILAKQAPVHREKTWTHGETRDLPDKDFDELIELVKTKKH